MNKQMVRVLAGILLVVVAAGCKKPAKPLGVTVPATFVPHSAGNLSLKTPPTWKEKKAENPQAILVLMADDGICNINFIMVSEIPDTRDPNELAKQVEKGVAGQLQGFHLKTAESILVAGEDSPRIIYDGSMSGVPLSLQQTMIVKGGKTYIMTFTAPAASYNKYAPAVDQILESIQISK